MKTWITRLQARNDIVGCLAQALLTAIAYSVIGWVAMYQVIPPATAALVWPSAGIALAAVLLFRWPAVFGTWLGSFAISIYLYLETGYTVPAVGLAAAGAVGTALQAWIGAALIRRFVGFPTPLIRDRDILMFLVLGGPIACILNATIRVLVLYAGNRITLDGIDYLWFAWWVGHTTGVLIFAPLALLVTADLGPAWRARRLSVGLPLIATFVVSVMAFVFGSMAERRQVQVDLDRRVDAIGAAVQARLSNSIDALHSLRSFYASSEVVSRAEFRTFVNGVIPRQPGIYALVWLRYVQGDRERTAFEETLRAEGFAGAQIREQGPQGLLVPAQRRERYLALEYIEPFAGHESRIGYDAYSRSVNTPMQDRAIETGEPTLTGRFHLLNEPESQYAVAVYMPVYRNGVNVAAQGDRRSALVGMLTASYRVSDLVNAALAGVDRDGVELEIVDESAETDADRILVSMAPQRAPLHGASHDMLQHSVRLDIAGRQWMIRGVQSEASLLARHSATAWMALLGGLLFTSLLGGFLMILTGQAARVQALVDERTAELSEANTDLSREQARIALMVDELRLSKEQAEVATRAKSEFLANMSHEIRTPMTAILGFTGLVAQDSFDSPDAKEKAVQAIQRNGEHLLTIINDILDLSKIEAGKLSIEQIPIKPDELLHDVRRTFTDLAKSKGIELLLSLPDEPVPAILGDPVRVRQVVMNLVSNAIKFTMRGTVTLTLMFNRERRDLTITVADSGIGMTAEQVSALFQPFSQAETSTARRFGGTGLGLRISKRLAEMMGGNLTVHSVAEKGTVFTYQLFARTIAAGADVRPEGVSAPSLGAKPLTGLHILAVDDSPDNRALVEMLLQRAGARVTLLELGTQAIDWVQERLRNGQADAVHDNPLGIDLILMDMQMPGLDGAETVRRLRAMRAPVAIVALTANAMESDRIRCFEAGFDDFIAKPINPPLLFEKCRKWATYSRSYVDG